MSADSGCALLRHSLSAQDCEALLNALVSPEAVRTRAGARHLMRIPAVAGVANSLAELAAPWIGETAVPFRATFFEKTKASNWLIPWHQDTALPLATRHPQPGWGPWTSKSGVLYAHAPAWALVRVVALRVHLDESGPLNGPLRVIPGSHQREVLTDAEVHEVVAAGQPVECLAPRGGVLAMRPLTIHASSKATVPLPRRVLHIEYADGLELAPGVQLALA